MLHRLPLPASLYGLPQGLCRGTGETRGTLEHSTLTKKVERIAGLKGVVQGH